MNFFIFIFIFSRNLLPVFAERPELRNYKWKYNNPKEDPLARRKFEAKVPGTCDETLDIQDEMSGQLVTEGFEDYYYKNDSDCTWIISGSDNLKISYEIAYLDLEPGPPFCPFDYLQVSHTL